MKIKLKLNGRERTLVLATEWSLLLTFSLLIFLAAIIYKMAPENVSIRIPTTRLSDGQRSVIVRAVTPDSSHKQLFVGEVDATVKAGVLTTNWTPPTQLLHENYIVEVCTNIRGTQAGNCFTQTGQPSDTAAQQGEEFVAGSTSQTGSLVSCPYYVSTSKTNKFANLLGINQVDLESRVYCSQTVTGAEEFAPYSRTDVIKATNDNGLTYGNGVVISTNGVLSNISYEELFSKLDVKEATQEVVNNYTIASEGTDNQTLSLTGHQLSISGGNTVVLPETSFADASSTQTGLLNASDWSSFAAKENSLTFSDGLVRSGNTIGIMSCAANEVIKSDGSSWLCAQDIVGSPGNTYSAGTGLTLVGTTFNNAGVLSVTASGALTSSGGQNPAISLATSTDLAQLAGQLGLSNTGVSAGTYNNVTVDSKGRVTAGTNISYLTTEQDGVIGNEVAGAVTGGGLIMSGSGTTLDPYKLGMITSCSSGQLMKWSGSAWACANDTDTNTDAQTLSFNPGTGDLSLTNGGTVNLSALNTDAQSLSVTGSGLTRQLSISGGNNVGLADSDNQTLSLASNTLSLTNGGSVNLAPYLDNTDSQALSIAGNVISLTNGGSITLPADQDTTYSAGNGLSLAGTVFAINAPTCAGTTKLQWNGSAFICASDVDTDTDAQTLSWNGGTRTLSILNGNSVVISDADTTYSAGTGITLTGTTFSLTNDFGASIDSSEITDGTIAAADLATSGATAGTYGDTGVNVAQLTVNNKGQVTAVSNRALPTANTTTTGVLSSSDWNTFNGKENVLTFTDGLSRVGNSVTLMDCAASQILQRNGGDTAWVCANQVVDTNTTYSAGTGLSLVGTTFSNAGVLSVTASGALASSGGQNPAITLAASSDFSQLANQLSLSDSGVTAGTYNNVTVDSKGRVTNGSNISYLTSETDGVIGNEVADVVLNGGLVMTGAGTSVSPYKVGLITTCADNQLLKYTSASGWACASDIDTDTNTDAQTLTWNTGTNNLSISGGNSVNLSSLLDNTDSQALSWNGGTRTLSLTNGGSVVISDADTTYSAGDGLSLTGTVFAINAPTCAGTTKLQWNGSAFVCAVDVDTDTDAQTLSWNGGTRTLSIVGGNSVVVPDADTTYSAGTGITLTGTTFSLTNDFGSSIDSSEITNGTIAAADLANSGASAGTYGDSGVNIAQLTVNAQGQVTAVSNRALPTANGTTTGVISSSDWTTFNGKENVLTFSDGLLRSSNTVTLMDCAASQILQRNAGDTAWVCANQVIDTNTTYSAGTGLSLVGTTFSNTGVLGVGASGALTSSGGQNPAITLATSSDLTQLGSQLALSTTGVTAGSYNNVTVDAQGRVTNGSNISYLTSEADGVIGNEVADVALNGGLIMTGAGTSISPYKVGLVTTCADNQLLKYTSAGGWACANDIDTNTDAQTLTWNTGTNSLSISGGNSVNLSSLLDNTDAQTLSWNGGTRTLSLTNGGSVVISDTDTTYSAGTGITLTGTTFSLTNDFGSSIDSSEITNGTIAAADLANSGASAGTYGDSGVNVAQLTVNAQGQVTAVSNRALPTANTTTTGVLSSSDWNIFNGKENVLTFSDGLARSTNTVTLMDCAASQILQRNGGDTAWVCANQVVDTNTTYSAGTGLSLVGTTFNNTGVLSVGASGALTSSGGQNPAITLATSADLSQLGAQLGLTDTGITAGSYNNVTVDAKGRVTSGSNISYLTSETDGVIGNEVADVVTNGGLVMTGAGTGVSPYKVGLITTCADNQLLKYTAAGGWACANDIDTDTNTDSQTLTWNTGTNSLSISGGNSVNLSSLLDNTDSQTLGLAGNTLSLTNGGSVDLSGYLDNTDSQTLSWNGGTRTLSLTGGGSVVISDADTTYSAGTGITLTGTTFSLTNDFGVSIDSSEITNGTIAAADLANSGATAGTYGDSGVNVAQLTVNAQGQVTAVSNRALPTASGSTTGVLSSSDWTTFNGKENVLTFSDGLARSTNTVTLMDCAASQILQRNGGDTAWVCANQVVDTNTTYSAGTGLSLVGTTFSNTGVLSVGASGALTSSGGQNPAITLATTSDLTQLGSQLGLTDTGVTAGSYNNVTVDAKGRVTGGSNISYLTSEVDGVIGNEVADVALNGGLVMTGAGTSVSPYKVGLITTCADNQLLKYTSAGGWACANDIDTDTNTDSQTLTWNTGTNNLSISGGNSVNLSSLLDNTDSQTLGLAGNTLSLTNGGSVDLSGYLDNTDSQALSWNGGTRTLSLTNGGSVVISDADTTYSAGTGITLTGTTFSLTNDFGSSIDSSEITNGTIAAADLANSGATAGTYGDTGVNVAQLTVNAQGQVTSISNRALPTANTTTTGVLSNTDWNTFNGKENVLTFTGNGLFSRAGNTITGIAGTVSGQVLKWNGSAWATGTDNDTTYTNGNGLSLASTTFSINAPTCAGTTKLQWNGSAFVCSADVDTDTDTTNFNIRANAGVSANIAAGNTISFIDGTGTSASRSSNDVSFSLTNVGTAGTYGSATAVPVITTDAQGRVTGVTSTPINFPAEVDGVIGNEVTNATTNGGLTRSGSGTSGSPYTLGLLTTCGDQQVLKYTLGTTTWGCANDTDTNTTYSAGTGLTLIGTTFSLTNDFGASIDSSEITDGTIAAADLATSGATAGTYGDTGVNVTQLTVNNKGQVTAVSNRALPTANTTTTGVLSNGDWNTFNGKENVLTFTGNGLFSRAGNTITGIAGTVSGQVLKWNGSAWATGTDNDTTYTNGNGLSLSTGTFSINSPTCAGTTKLQWNGSAFVCSADVDTDTDTTNFNIRANAGASANIAAGNTISFVDGTGTTASRTTNDISFSLTNVGTAGTYGSATAVPVITTDAQGRVTSVTSTPINFPAEVDGVVGNEVTNATANGGLTRSGSGTGGSPYTLGLLTTCGDQQVLKYTLGTTTWGCANDTDTNTTYTNGTGLSLGGTTFSITSTGVTANSYAPANNANGSLALPQFTVNAQGQLTAASTTNVTLTGIANSQLANSSLTVTAGNGLANGGSVSLGGTTTLNVGAGAGITVNADDITVDLTVATDALSATTSSGSGLEVLASGVTLLQGCSDGQVLKWTEATDLWGCANDNGTAYSAGTGISIVTGTISATLGTDIDSSEIVDGTIAAADLATSGATAGTYGDTGVNVAQLTVNNKGQVTAVSNRALPTANTTTTGVLSSSDWNTFNGKENVLTFTGNGLFSRAGNTVTGLSCTGSQIAKWNGSSFSCGSDTDTTYSAGAGIALTSTTFSIECTTSPVAFCNNGDSFGAAAVLGTNDANSLSFETNNATAATFSSTGEFLLKDPSDNAISFQVQDSAALPMFTVDTVANQILVGSSTTDANAIQLVLDSYNSATDPAGTNGAMYYNSALAKFRCYQNSMWNDCGNGFNTLTKTADQIATANSTAFQNDNTLFFAAAANTTYVFDAWIPVNDSNATADLKYTFTTPTGATQNILTSYYASATTFTQCNIITSGQTCANTTVNRTDHFIQVRGVVYNAGTAGNVQFQFAQNTATAAVSSPTIKKGATLSWHRSN